MEGGERGGWSGKRPETATASGYPALTGTRGLASRPGCASAPILLSGPRHPQRGRAHLPAGSPGPRVSEAGVAASLKPRGPERAPRPGCRVHPGFPASAAPSRAPGAKTRTHQSASAAAPPWLSVWSPLPPSSRQPWGGVSSRRPLPVRAARRPPPGLAEAGLGFCGQKLTCGH
ncbi:uncharacterized protein LOC106993580 [Macaca mulatta]